MGQLESDTSELKPLGVGVQINLHLLVSIMRPEMEWSILVQLWAHATRVGY